MIASLGAFAGGAFAWTLGEYLLHRFVGHGPKRKAVVGLGKLLPSGLAAEFNREHLAHHADPSYFAPSSRKAVAGSVVSGALGAGLSLLLGPGLGVPFALGFALVYVAYEVIHRRVHTHPPAGPFSRWVRRHHLYHHHRSPRLNHGVTSPLWDRVFGTLVVVDEPIAIPRRLAPRWLVDPVSGEVAIREGFSVLG